MSTARVEPASCTPNPDGTCSICGDEAHPGIIERIDSAGNTAEVRLDTPTGTQLHTVAVDLLDEVNIGDTVMVHLGFAIARVHPPVIDKSAMPQTSEVVSER